MILTEMVVAALKVHEDDQEAVQQREGDSRGGASLADTVRFWEKGASIQWYGLTMYCCVMIILLQGPR